jgi:transcriptional regulator with PAS, ATPase and Fis domain
LNAADKGTLYLDDIGEMSPRMQVNLLRVLQEGSYTPLGGLDQIRVDFRLVVSSKVPLDVLQAQGLLREDLLYRLQVVVVEIPPLCERSDDIPVLVQRFMTIESAAMGKPMRGLSKEAFEALVAHTWPGNIRELEQTIRRAIIVGEGRGPVAKEEIFAGKHHKKSDGAIGKKDTYCLSGGNEGDNIAMIRNVLERHMWNRTRAAKAMGIPRRTFYRKLKKYGLLD